MKPMLDKPDSHCLKIKQEAEFSFPGYFKTFVSMILNKI
jgi:hypothetical protein